MLCDLSIESLNGGNEIGSCVLLSVWVNITAGAPLTPIIEQTTLCTLASQCVLATQLDSKKRYLGWRILMNLTGVANPSFMLT
jgi:hypothetical protein